MSRNTSIILWGNALLLIVGTLAQNWDSPFRHLVLSIVFVAWLGLFAWHVMSAAKEPAAKTTTE
jgi:hypothetical protein